VDKFKAKKLIALKRKTQACKVYQLKIDHSHLSTQALSHLYSLFREARWFYNYCLSHQNVNDSDTTAKSVPVKVGEAFEVRTFSVISAQMKQSIKNRLFNNLVSLKALKEKGFKVGRLKFKKEVNSIPLKQIGNAKHSGTYYLDKARSRIRVQGMKRWLKVRGLEQIPENCEITCGTLVCHCGDFYLHVTTFEDKTAPVVPERAIGIDFGCESQLTFSDGTKVQFQVPVSERLKRLDRRIDKKVNGKIGKHRASRNRRKLQLKRQKEYARLTNKRADIRHKLVHAITHNYKYVCVQDESIAEWKRNRHGKKIQFSAIGAILADLKHKSAVPVLVSKWFPSTQLCPQCGAKHKLKESERVYKCACGYVEDRDIKSAICLLEEGKKIIPMDCRNFKLEESVPTVFFETLMRISGVGGSKGCSLSQEAPRLAVG
jgi:putative transposase